MPALGVPLQPLQIRSHVGCVLVAQIAVFLQSLVDDPFQFGGNSGFSRTAEQVRGSGSHRRSLAVLSPRNGNVPGGHLIEDSAKGEQISARIQFLGPRLLRRHIGDGAERRAGTGQVLLIQSSDVFAEAIWLDELLVGATFASPKSRILACPRLVTKIWRA